MAAPAVVPAGVVDVMLSGAGTTQLGQQDEVHVLKRSDDLTADLLPLPDVKMNL